MIITETVDGRGGKIGGKELLINIYQAACSQSSRIAWYVTVIIAFAAGSKEVTLIEQQFTP